jgi:hypothetical protein
MTRNEDRHGGTQEEDVAFSHPAAQGSLEGERTDARGVFAVRLEAPAASCLPGMRHV